MDGLKVAFGLLVLTGILVSAGVSLVAPNLNNQPVVAQVSSTTEQTSGSDKSTSTTYLVNLKTEDGEITPFIVENHFLVRWDRSTVFGQMKELEKRGACISFTAYAWRIPAISYQGIKDEQVVPCPPALANNSR